MMSAYSVMDSVNKYRHGVLIGNFVEDKFGKDLTQKGPNPDAPKLPTTKDHHDIRHSLYQPNELIASQPQNGSQFYESARGFNGQSYKRPEQQTTYNIFHQQEVHGRVPLLENNPKREERLEIEGKSYEQTRINLANKFVKPQCQDQALKHLSDEIPDILTGQIFRAKANLGSELKPQNKGKMKIESNHQTKSINPFGTYSIVKPQIKRFEEVEYNKFVYPSHKGEQRDLLFGHGLALEEFQRRQLATTYDLSYHQRVPPQTQVNSFYEPNPRNTTKEFHHETLYEKNHQINIPPVGQTKTLSQEKAGRPYQPHTGTFDNNHLKHQYLRK